MLESLLSRFRRRKEEDEPVAPPVADVGFGRPGSGISTGRPIRRRGSPPRVTVVENADGQKGSWVVFSEDGTPTVHNGQDSDVTSVTGAAMVVLVATIPEERRQNFVEWSGIPLPWGSDHERLFLLAFRHYALASEKTIVKDFPKPRFALPPLPKPLSPEIEGYFDRMFENLDEED